MTQPSSAPIQLTDLERWVTGQAIAPAEASILAQLAQSRVAGALAGRWQGTPAGLALRPQALRFAFAHRQSRDSLRPLLAAWGAAGIQSVLLKGFYLAEFEYSLPGQRTYGDVDIFLPVTADLWPALHLALALGWRSDGLHAQPEHWTHEVAHLTSPGGEVRIDLHRFPYRVGFWPQPRQRQLTQAFWQRCRPVPEGLPLTLPGLFLPAAQDAALGLALTRAWGRQSEGLRPSDYLDLEVLIQRHQLTEQEMLTHAQATGAGHTWAAFVAHCHPWQKRLHLKQAAADLQLAARQDNALTGRRRWAAGRRVQGLWQVARVIPGILPDVLAAQQAIRQGGDPREHLKQWPLNPTHGLTPAQRDLIIRAIHLITRLLYFRRQQRKGVCVPRSYATYRALQRRGQPGVFVSGVRLNAGGGVNSHAWVESPQGPFEAYHEPLNRKLFRIMLEYPAPELHLPAEPADGI